MKDPRKQAEEIKLELGNRVYDNMRAENDNWFKALLRRHRIANDRRNRSAKKRRSRANRAKRRAEERKKNKDA